MRKNNIACKSSHVSWRMKQKSSMKWPVNSDITKYGAFASWSNKHVSSEAHKCTLFYTDCIAKFAKTNRWLLPWRARLTGFSWMESRKDTKSQNAKHHRAGTALKSANRLDHRALGARRKTSPQTLVSMRLAQPSCFTRHSSAKL